MIHQAKSYLNYLGKAKSINGDFDPFISNLLLHVFDKKDEFYAFKAIELIRNNLKLNNTKIEVKDLGAGSKKGNQNERSINQIINSSAKAPKYGQLLFRLANYLEVNNAIELGTSLGISTAYIKKARKNAMVYTLEGAPNIVKVAKRNFQTLKLKKLEVIEGNFDQTLPDLLKRFSTVDFVFFDGNHKHEATLNYFEQCLEKVNNRTVFIFDDIYWSEGMTKAWKTIQKNDRVTTTIDIFEMGFVFFNPELSKQDLIIKY